MKFRSIIFMVVAAALSCACTVFNLDEGGKTDVNKDDDSILTGIWQVKGFRLAGANLMQINPLEMIIIDEGNSEMAFINKFDENGEETQLAETYRLELTDTQMTLYRKTTETLENQFEYHLSDDKSTLFIYPKAVSFVNDPRIDEEEAEAEMSITLVKDAELETKAMAFASQTQTKGFWDYIKLIPAMLGIMGEIIPEIIEDKYDSNFVDPYVPTTSYKEWGHTSGWRGKNWMSFLDKDLPVCEVNIPGSHDSATATSKMGADAIAVSADCQTYTIDEQYERGARYFDLRVGNQFEWATPLISKRLPNQEECDAKSDLLLYHGNFCTDTKYKETLAMLANKIREGGDTEFVFVSTQFEDLSYGLLDKGSMWADDKLGIGDGNVQGYFVEELKKLTMDIANRLQRELNHAYKDTLFINYSPELTVEKARGHIILMEESHGDANASANKQCSYVLNWPYKTIKYSYLGAYDKCDEDSRKSNALHIIRNGWGYNAYVQNDYEMFLDDDITIDTKKKHMQMVADSTTYWNMFQGKRILGFNPTNANPGAAAFYDLDVYEFAHKFNGAAVNLYVENMLNTRGMFRYHSGLVPMDHFGAKTYDSVLRTSLVDVYGDLLAWAVIESNFYDN